MVGLAIKPTSASRFKRLERFRHDQDIVHEISHLGVVNMV